MTALWIGTGALGAISAALVPHIAQAATAPSPDIIIPAGSGTDVQCEAGVYKAVLCLTDNAAVYYYMDSSGEFELEEPDRTAVKAAMAKYRNETVLTVTYDADPDFANDKAETDFIFQEGKVPGLSKDVRGTNWCNSTIAGTRHRCDQHFIRIRGDGVYDVDTAAHESGHALGLTHGANARPVQDNCSSVMGTMRTPTGCRTSADLGPLVRKNIDWMY